MVLSDQPLKALSSSIRGEVWRQAATVLASGADLDETRKEIYRQSQDIEEKSYEAFLSGKDVNDPEFVKEHVLYALNANHVLIDFLKYFDSLVAQTNFESPGKSFRSMVGTLRSFVLNRQLWADPSEMDEFKKLVGEHCDHSKTILKELDLNPNPQIMRTET